MRPSPATATDENILIAAESLFAINGYGAVSLRQITAKAGANLAAVNYYFYDKESLYRIILTRRLRQINGARLLLLRKAENEAGTGRPPLATIMDALARPLFLPGNDYSAFATRLVGRLLLERQPFTEELLRDEFQPVMTRFGQAIRRHVPSLPPQEFLWRLSFIIGALHHSLATLDDMRNLTQGICSDDDAESALANFTKFAATSLG